MKLEMDIKKDGKHFATVILDGRNQSLQITEDDSVWKNRKEKSKIFQTIKLYARDMQAEFSEPKFLD